jgi:hypothetical protein
MDSSNVRIMVRGAYDLQKLRIQTGNRIVANFKAKLGQAPSEAEETLEEEEQEILDDLRIRYRKLTDGVKTFPKQATFKGDEVISSFTELCLIAQYISLEDQEGTHFKRVEQILTEYPIYTEFLLGVKGCGPAMSAVLLSEIDIHQAKYASSLWKLAGYDVVIEDNKGRSRIKAHLVPKSYTNKAGEVKETVGITFNPFLKTKLYVLGTCFLKVKESPYKEAYYNYKNRIENDPRHVTKTKLHRHRMAMRYMVKRFLVDLYYHWRELEGLEVHPEYSEGKLGMVHGT